MKIHKIKSTELSFNFVANREIKLSKDCEIEIETDVGFWYYKLKKGFRTDGRSGGLLVDLVLPHYGEPKYSLAWAIHDANHDKHCLSFERTNILFREMLKFAGVGRFKSWLAYRSVNGFYGRELYNDQTERNKSNHKYIEFEWNAEPVLNGECEIEMRRR